MSESHQEVSSTSSSPDIPTIADEVTFSDAVESNELHTEVEGGEEKEEEEEENEVVEVEVGVEEGEEESKVALETVVVAELECTESAAVLTEVTENCVEVELDAKLPSCSKVIPKSKHRVYIKNIPYYSTEDELEAFFIDYNV